MSDSFVASSPEALSRELLRRKGISWEQRIDCYQYGLQNEKSCCAAFVSTLLAPLQSNKHPAMVVTKKQPRPYELPSNNTTPPLSSNIPATMMNAVSSLSKQPVDDFSLEELLEFRSSDPRYLADHGVKSTQSEVSIAFKKTFKRTQRGAEKRLIKATEVDSSMVAKEIAAIHDKNVELGMAAHKYMRPEFALKGLHNISEEELEKRFPQSNGPYFTSVLEEHARIEKEGTLVNGKNSHKIHDLESAINIANSAEPTEEDKNRMNEIKLSDEDRAKWYLSDQDIGLLDNLAPNERIGVNKKGQFYVATEGALERTEDGSTISGFNIPAEKRKRFRRAVATSDEVFETTVESYNNRIEADEHEHQQKRQESKQQDNGRDEIHSISEDAIISMNAESQKQRKQYKAPEVFNVVEEYMNLKEAKFTCSSKTFLASTLSSSVQGSEAHESLFPNGKTFQHVVPISKRVIEMYLCEPDPRLGQKRCIAGDRCEALRMIVSKPFALRTADCIPRAMEMNIGRVSMNNIDKIESMRSEKDGLVPCMMCYLNEMFQSYMQVDGSLASTSVDVFLGSIFCITKKVGEFSPQDCVYPSNKKYNGMAGPLVIHTRRSYKLVINQKTGIRGYQFLYQGPTFNTELGFPEGPK